MNKLLAVIIAAVFATVSYSAIAADTAMAPAKPAAKSSAPKKLTPQQEKMRSCNKDAKAKGLKKAERKAFMKTCLSGDTAAK